MNPIGVYMSGSNFPWFYFMDVFIYQFHYASICYIYACRALWLTFKKCVLMKYKKLYFFEVVVVKCRRHEPNGCLDVG